MPQSEPDRAPGAATGLQCLHEDSHLLVLAKPTGLLCVPGRGPDKQDCLSRRAQAQWADALVVHRLDQATSGLVLMARNTKAQRRLGRAFELRQVHKRYLAVVAGALAQAPDGAWSTIDLPIAADWERRPLRTIDPHRGKPSQTRWRSVRHDAARGVTLLDLEPLTGRSHQLRLHLASIGHPILGDALYADAATQAMAPRLLLHACALAFAHPMGGQPCCFTLPAEFGKNGL